MKKLMRGLGFVFAALLSVVAVQRLIHKLYCDVGKHYVLVGQESDTA